MSKKYFFVGVVLVWTTFISACSQTTTMNESTTSSVLKASTTSIPSCNLVCLMSIPSGIRGVMVPKNVEISKTQFGSIKYSSDDLNGKEISRYYMDALAEDGWKFQASEGTNNSDSGTKSLVWCRVNPSVLNLLISVSSPRGNLALDGTDVLIMSDNYDDVPCV